MRFSIDDFFGKCDQIRRKWIWSRLLKKSLMKNFLFCAVMVSKVYFSIISPSAISDAPLLYNEPCLIPFYNFTVSSFFTLGKKNL